MLYVLSCSALFFQVRSADCIFVIKDGQVVEQGTHDDLIQVEDGAYSALISRQMQAQKTLENHGGPVENGQGPTETPL
jgi:ABC-type dipeptide/oligopeptide/nickel transport system ATPase component